MRWRPRSGKWTPTRPPCACLMAPIPNTGRARWKRRLKNKRCRQLPRQQRTGSARPARPGSTNKERQRGQRLVDLEAEIAELEISLGAIGRKLENPPADAGQVHRLARNTSACSRNWSSVWKNGRSFLRNWRLKAGSRKLAAYRIIPVSSMRFHCL